LLRESPVGDARRDDIQQIMDAARSAATLTRQLLAFSRQQALNPQVLSLNDAVTNAQKLLSRLVGEDISVVTTLAPGLRSVLADPGELEQVIINLAVNARDAMPDGGTLILETANFTLDAAYTAEPNAVTPGEYVQLVVSDSGAGMDEETQRRLFEPFFTTKEPGRGTGLGLATVYGIVKQSGGHIWVYSERDHGTTFKLYFPATDDRVVLERNADQPVSVPDGTETVLLVEDDRAVRTVARDALRRGGYLVLEASDGEAAVAVAAGHSGTINLLVTDVILPGLHGRHLAERLSASHAGLRVLFISGYTNDTLLQRGMLGPGIALLQKPFTPESLTRRVREMLDDL